MMTQDLYRIEEAYKAQLLNEGIIWDGVKWVWRKLKNAFKVEDPDKFFSSVRYNPDEQNKKEEEPKETPKKKSNPTQSVIFDIGERRAMFLLDNASISNGRFNKSQFTKYCGQGDLSWCAVVDDESGKCLALCAVKTNTPYSGCHYIAEVQSMESGYGSKLIRSVVDKYNAVWLIADVNADSSLLSYYRNLGFFREYVLRDSTYGKPVHFFYTSSVSEGRLIEYVKSTFSK